MAILTRDCLQTVDDDGIYHRATVKDLMTEIVRLRGQLEAAEQHVKILQEQRDALEPPPAISPWALCYTCEQSMMEHDVGSTLACGDFTLHPL